MKYSKGFTLLEILLVIAAISILALIIIIAINPNRQLAQVRNSARYSDLSTISDALSQYFIDNGEYPAGLSETYQEICVQDASDCTGYLDIRNALVPTYIASIPQDPETLSSGTGYEVMIHPVNQKISVQAIYAELGASILINPVPLWTPAQVSTQLWLDQSDISSITFASLDNAQVSQWNDKSGNNRHAIQGVSDSQPILSQGGVSFDGTDDFLNVDLDFLSGTDHQAYIVADNISNHSNFYGATTGGSGSESLHVGFRNTSSFRINYWGNDFYPPIGNEYIMGEQNLISFRWLTGVGKEAFANGYSQGSNTSAGSISPMRNGGRILCVVTHGCMQANIKEIIFVTGSNISSDTDERLTGYLAHKWAIQDKLPTNHPYYSAPPLNWTPEDISTDLWLDASDTTSFQYNSDVNTYIEQWSDKSGNGHHATQSQVAFYPIYEDNAIFFDGDYLEVDLDFMAGVNHSAFIVVRPETPYSNIYGAATPAQGSGSLHIGFRNDSEYRVNYWNNDFEASIGSAFVPGGFNLLQFEWVTGVQKSVFANATLEATGSGAGTITPMAGGGRLLGVTTPNHDNMVARIQEMIVITDTEMNQATYDRITGYLAHKWDIQAQLPLTHVYRTEPPLLE